MKRALIVLPGRGSYDRSGLGQLQDRSEAARGVVERCDAFRAAVGEPTVSELDAAERFKTTLHVAGEHASILTFACSLADLADLDRSRYEIVGVTGNSMGFYTALAAAGALSLDHAIQLVDTMGRYQRGNVLGGQVLYPVTGDDWQEDPERIAAVEETLAAARRAGHGAWWSIRLGGHAVLGADSEGVRFLLANLPKIETSTRSFPLQLPLHSAFHTPIMQAASERALVELDALGWRAPDVPLIDGRGFTFRPRWTSPEALRDYTLGHQVVEAYDFTVGVRAAMHHTAPDVVIVLGPGNSLGGPLARIVVQDGWSGLRTKEALSARQDQDPILLSFGVPAQRRILLPASRRVLV